MFQDKLISNFSNRKKGTKQDEILGDKNKKLKRNDIWKNELQ